jgi:hypothetical protein
MLVKKVVKAALYAGIVGAFAFGCGSFGVGNWEEEDESLQSWFDGLLAEQYGVTQHAGSIPRGNSNLISEVSMGSVVNSGGSMTIAIRSYEELTRVYISFDNESNVYYEVELTDDDFLGYVGGVYLYTPVIYFSQSSRIVNNGRVTLRLVVESYDDLSNITNREIVTQVVGSGLLQLALNWDTQSDLDLHVRLPDNTHIYFGNKVKRNAAGDTLVHLDRDYLCSNIAGQPRVENIYFRSLENGLYLVWVRQYSSCNNSDDPFTLTATSGGRILGNGYLQYYRGDYSGSNRDIKLGVITVRNGSVVQTDYNASDVRALLSSSLKQIAEETK